MLKIWKAILGKVDARPLATGALTLSVSLLLALLLTGCGQPGPLYLPKDPASKQRAGLLGSLWPFMPSKKNKDAAANAPQSQGDDQQEDEDTQDVPNAPDAPPPVIINTPQHPPTPTATPQ